MQASVKAFHWHGYAAATLIAMDGGMNGWKQASGQQLIAYMTSPLAVCRYDWRPSSA